jgi:hypothetical protein
VALPVSVPGARDRQRHPKRRARSVAPVSQATGFATRRC